MSYDGAVANARDFGAALRAAREDAGLSLKRAADAIGVSHNALGNWELGKRKKRLPRAVVEKLEATYGVEDRRLLVAGGYVIGSGPAGAYAPGARPVGEPQSLAYGGEPLTADEARDVLHYIDFVRSRRSG